jgi:imidazolonepropionase-like amidohydrolase
MEEGEYADWADAPPADKPEGDKPGAGKPGGDGAKKDDGPKKPTEPPRDPSKDVLIRALNGEIPVRVWVERPEDILQVLAIGREFGLNLILEGASGAGRVVKQLCEVDATVILGPPAADMKFDPGARRFADPATAKKLEEAGIRVFLGSGPTEGGADLALMAAAAIGYGWDAGTAWKRITGEAVELLAAGKRIGSLDMGDPADFVVWSGHPLAPGSRVERVFIDGIEVYTAREGGR